ncbi:hypothetical protein [Arcicella rigui]|uniref:PIK-related kinase FAT domain-containing protein n=1 Tax=Arcicella rigui TaxID=797020 RepID=A0ABU5Q864_9BACT|nr:hypothetical protein [Arcicella rigui]MEA5139025.1 hypothetical protein [Arcicella rigui]
MTYSEFKASLQHPEAPQGVHELLKALWYDANQDWEAAHEVAQSNEGSKNYDRLHAYLHRKEGDNWNAQYWYTRAKAKVFMGTLQEEWEMLVNQFLAL